MPGLNNKAIRERNREAIRGALTVYECADRLNCHHATVRRAIHGGQLRGFRVGNEIRVLPEDLDAYIESRVVSA